MLRLLAAGVHHGVQQPAEAVRPDGLDLIVIRAHRIGFHGELRGRGEKNNFYVAVILADLPGGGDAVFAGHDHIQEQHVRPQALGDLSQQLQRTVKRRAGDFHTAAVAVLRYQPL